MTDARKQGAGESGFSLIELMVALVIISVGVLGLSAIQTRSSSGVYASGRQSGALAVAQERIEIARFNGYLDAVADSGQTGPYTYTSRWDSISIELRQITVTVNWREQTTTQSLQLQTLVSKR